MHKSTGQRDRSDATIGPRFETRRQCNELEQQTDAKFPLNRLDRESNHRQYRQERALVSETYRRIFPLVPPTWLGTRTSIAP